MKDTTMNTGAASLSDEQIEALKAAALAATPQDIDGAQRIDRYEDGSHILCPACGGEGYVELNADFCNYDGEAMGVQFYGIGNAHVLAEAYFRAAKPATVLALIERLERAEATPTRQADAAIAAGGAQEPARVDTGPNLEGLREKLLAPRSIERTSDGWLYHPDYPTCDEGTRADKFLEAFGIETAFVGMESDAPDLAERWHEEGLTDCSEWTPTPPGGDGWLLLEIYDTEDGPYALFGRDHYAAEQARKKEHTRRLSEAVRRARLERAAASNGEQA